VSYVEVPVGEGRIRVHYTRRSAYIIDSLTLTRIYIFYHPYRREWIFMLTGPGGEFVKELRYVSACATGVFEYCARRWATGNLYVDVLYCEALYPEELTAYWRPWRPILEAYYAGYTRPYYRWLRAILPDVARHVAGRLAELLGAAAGVVEDVITGLFGVEPEYIGYTVTGYKYCAGVLYGLYCRMEPDTCMLEDCLGICSVAALSYPEACGPGRERECIERKEVWRPIGKIEYLKERE